MSAGEKKYTHVTKAVEYGTISLVCVSSCHWTAGPQRAVFHQRCDHRRLEAWPCLPQKSHSQTTKCSRCKQAAQPLWFLLLLRKIHTDTLANAHIRFCMQIQSPTQTCLNAYQQAKCAMCIHTHTNHNITPLQSCAERGR